jgi:hypothetical protein
VADVSGPEGVYWNPAGLTRSQGTSALFSRTSYLADMTMSFAALSIPMRFGQLGLSARLLDLGSLIVTTEEYPDGTGETIEPRFATMGVSLARILTDHVSFGVSALYVSERISQQTAQGLAFDIGCQYHLPLSGLHIGLAMKSFGPQLRFDGPELESWIVLPEGNPQGAPRAVRTRSAAFELPTHFDLGVSYDMLRWSNAHVTLAGAFQSNNFFQDEYRLGAEYAWEDRFFLRMGHSDSAEEGYLYGPSFGVGFAIPMSHGRMKVDYTYSVINSFFSDIQHLGVSFDY